jgi:hypothetical protein
VLCSVSSQIYSPISYLYNIVHSNTYLFTYLSFSFLTRHTVNRQFNCVSILLNEYIIEDYNNYKIHHDHFPALKGNNLLKCVKRIILESCQKCANSLLKK